MYLILDRLTCFFLTFGLGFFGWSEPPDGKAPWDEFSFIFTTLFFFLGGFLYFHHSSAYGIQVRNDTFQHYGVGISGSCYSLGYRPLCVASVLAFPRANFLFHHPPSFPPHLFISHPLPPFFSPYVAFPDTSLRAWYYLNFWNCICRQQSVLSYPRC